MARPRLPTSSRTIQRYGIYGGLYEKLRIIIILRNPAERAYSHFMLHKRGYKEPLDFEKAIEPGTIAARRRDNWDIFYDYTGCGADYITSR